MEHVKNCWCVRCELKRARAELAAAREEIAWLERLIVASRHCNGGERKDRECADCPFLGLHCAVAHGLPADEALTEERGEGNEMEGNNS